MSEFSLILTKDQMDIICYALNEYEQKILGVIDSCPNRAVKSLLEEKDQCYIIRQKIYLALLEKTENKE